MSSAKIADARTRFMMLPKSNGNGVITSAMNLAIETNTMTRETKEKTTLTASHLQANQLC